MCYWQTVNTRVRLIRGRERREEKEKVKGDGSKIEIKELKICTTWVLRVMTTRVYSSADIKNVLLKWISVNAYFIQAYPLFAAGTTVPVYPTGILKQLASKSVTLSLSCDLQVMRDPGTCPALASSLSSKHWCAPRTATATARRGPSTPRRHSVLMQGVRGISGSFPVSLFWSESLIGLIWASPHCNSWLWSLTSSCGLIAVWLNKRESSWIMNERQTHLRTAWSHDAGGCWGKCTLIMTNTIW